MPDKDGLETIMDIQSHDPNAKIIAVLGGGSMLKESFLPFACAPGAVITLQKLVEINNFLRRSFNIGRRLVRLTLLGIVLRPPLKLIESDGALPDRTGR